MSENTMVWLANVILTVSGQRWRSQRNKGHQEQGFPCILKQNVADSPVSQVEDGKLSKKKRELGHTHTFTAFNCSNKDTVVLKQFKTIHLSVWSSPLFSFEKHNRLWLCSRVIIGLFSRGLLTTRQVLDCEVQR